MDDASQHESVIFALLGVLAGFALLLGLAIATYNRRHRDPSSEKARRDPLGAFAAHMQAPRAGATVAFEREGVPGELSLTVESRGDARVSRMRLRVGRDLAALFVGPERMVSGGDLWTGDPSFDGIARVQGDSALAMALLTPEVRRRLGGLLLQGWSVQGQHGHQALWLERYNDWLEDLPPMIDEAVAVARALAAPADLDARLCERLATEPSLEVRRRLARHLPSSLAGSARLRATLATIDDLGVRLMAAVALDASDLWQPLDEAALRALLRHDDPAVPLAAIEALGRRGTADSVPALRTIEDTDRPLEQPARDAIAHIQARVSGGHGGLSLARDQVADGGLSLANKPHGGPP